MTATLESDASDAAPCDAQSVVPQQPEIADERLQISALQRLLEVGISLSAERNRQNLLESIVREARALTAAEGGSLYIRSEEYLLFSVSQNEALDRDYQVDPDTVFKPRPLNLEQSNSIAAYVVSTGEAVTIDDVYAIPESSPYQFNPQFDRQTGYITHSMLTVPLRLVDSSCIGALQLVNCLDATSQVRAIQPFSDLAVSMALSLASQAAVAYTNVTLTDDLQAAHHDTLLRLSVAAEYRDRETASHLKRMSHYSRIIAKSLGLSAEQQELIFMASPMHDVGKIGIPDSILLKPGPLTDEERAEMQQHTIIGAEILDGSDSTLMQTSSTIALSHHERYDGSGYPYGLMGDRIPIAGRIVALADVFDALCSKRVYKPAWSLEDVFATVDRESGHHFDPIVVEAFTAARSDILEIYHRYQEASH